jgi:signal transduction histidine kinase
MELAASLVQRLPRHQDRHRVVGAACALAALVAVATSGAIAASGAANHPGLVALGRALIVGVPLAVGLYTWSRAGERFGLLIMALGGGWFLTTLAESGNELVYTLGRTAGWLETVLLVYVILAFPSGRLSGETDRVLVGAVGLVVLTTFLPRLALAQDFEIPSPYTSCTGDCPDNAFFLLDREPGFVDAVMRPLSALAAFAVMAAVLVRLQGRIRDATPLGRRMFTPVVVIGVVYVGFVGVGVIARLVDPNAWQLEVLAWLIALAGPAIALGFLGGLLRWRLFAGSALERLAECLSTVPDASSLRLAFADAFGDPTIQIAYPAGDSDEEWISSSGDPMTLPEPGSGRKVSEVCNHGAVVAAVIYDDALDASPRLVDAGVSMAGMVLDNQRLTAETQAALRQVRRSRARMAASADRERRRIERDLHDGAQQRLVALRIELELAEDLVRDDPERGVERLREFEHQLDEALEELRSLAHGVYPPLLADRGLTEALRAAAQRFRQGAKLDARDVGRYPQEVESAVYFCVLEALQNVLKHAGDARNVVVRIDGASPELRFSVSDDGAGTGNGALQEGAGITNMHDRLGSVGGDVSVTSTPGVGTLVQGRVPAPERLPDRSA